MVDYMKKLTRVVLGALVSAFAVGSLVGSAAYASIPDDGIIHGCYRPSGPAQGTLVVIDPDVETCPSGYTSLNWTQEPSATTLDREVITVSGVTGGTAQCPTGKIVISGGARWNGLGQGGSILNTWIVSSYPEPDGSGWTVIARASGGFTYDIYAVCVNE